MQVPELKQKVFFLSLRLLFPTFSLNVLWNCCEMSSLFPVFSARHEIATLIAAELGGDLATIWPVCGPLMGSVSHPLLTREARLAYRHAKKEAEKEGTLGGVEECMWIGGGAGEAIPQGFPRLFALIKAALHGRLEKNKPGIQS